MNEKTVDNLLRLVMAKDSGIKSIIIYTRDKQNFSDSALNLYNLSDIVDVSVYNKKLDIELADGSVITCHTDEIDDIHLFADEYDHNKLENRKMLRASIKEISDEMFDMLERKERLEQYVSTVLGQMSKIPIRCTSMYV